MKTGFTIIIFFLGILILCQTCTDCSEDNEEYVYILTYDSQYINECDSLQQQKVVSLSLLDFTLGDPISKNDLKSNPERLIKNLKRDEADIKGWDTHFRNHPGLRPPLQMEGNVQLTHLQVNMLIINSSTLC